MTREVGMREDEDDAMKGNTREPSFLIRNLPNGANLSVFPPSHSLSLKKQQTTRYLSTQEEGRHLEDKRKRTTVTSRGKRMRRENWQRKKHLFFFVIFIEVFGPKPRLIHSRWLFSSKNNDMQYNEQNTWESILRKRKEVRDKRIRGERCVFSDRSLLRVQQEALHNMSLRFNGAKIFLVFNDQT